VSSEVKERLQSSFPDIYQALEQDLYDHIGGWDMPSYIFDDITQARASTPEDTLISFAKVWASYYEVYQNSLVYGDAYAQVIQNILHRADHPDFAPFLRYVDFGSGHQMGLESFLLVIHRLSSSYRWNRSTRKYPVSVLSHTYIVTFFTYLLARER
jgi:hypothetical protein